MGLDGSYQIYCFFFVMDKNKRLDQNNEFSSQASVTAFFFIWRHGLSQSLSLPLNNRYFSILCSEMIYTTTDDHNPPLFVRILFSCGFFLCFLCYRATSLRAPAVITQNCSSVSGCSALKISKALYNHNIYVSLKYPWLC